VPVFQIFEPDVKGEEMGRESAPTSKSWSSGKNTSDLVFLQ
jgi:hypothetical protein